MCNTCFAAMISVSARRTPFALQVYERSRPSFKGGTGTKIPWTASSSLAMRESPRYTSISRCVSPCSPIFTRLLPFLWLQRTAVLKRAKARGRRHLLAEGAGEHRNPITKTVATTAAAAAPAAPAAAPAAAAAAAAAATTLD